MSMVINNNLMAVNTKRNFSNSANGMSSAMEKLSSGLKINSGKDDPSGLMISEQLRSQKAGLERAKQNTAEAMNVMSIAEGAMNEMNNILKKMKALAIHANSTGVTSPDQIAADQAEMDSAIQTIDRIAQTTKFAGESLINGNKELTFDQNTTVKATQNNKLLNARESSFSQIFKRDGYEVNISFNGTDAVNGTVDACGIGTKVNFAAQASKAYFEVDVRSNTHASDLKADGTFSHEQQFTLTGNRGARQYTIASGAHIGQMVKEIQNGADATGVTASLIFNSDQEVVINQEDNEDTTSVVKRTAGEIAVFNNNTDATAAQGGYITAVTEGGAGAKIMFGKNTDGQGNIYIKYTSDNTAELYKDASMSEESKVGTASRETNTFTVTEANYSGLEDLTWNVLADSVNMFENKGTYLNFGGIEGGAADGIKASDALFGTELDANTVYVAGVELGKNTSSDGEIFLKTTVDETGNATMQAYRHKDMKEEDLVAEGYIAFADQTADDSKIILNEIRNADETAGTGLGIIINLSAVFTPAATAGTTDTYNSKISFTNLGARVYAENYGADQYAKVTQDKGNSISYYADQGDSSTKTIVGAGNTVKQSGQDATLSINGRQVTTDGLRLKMATQDIQADFTFNEGKVGSTTLAQVGYGVGSAFTKAGALTVGDNTDADGDNITGFLANAGHTTTEQAENFEGGMQLQIGEGAGSNDRTVVGIKSMTSENLGRVTKTGMFEVDGKPIYTEKMFTMKDMLGGGVASLSQNATLAMEIIEKSINDVAGMRATLGAMQSNLLQTNENNLAVTIENVTKTESGIRDTDMADTMSEFTKQQVLQSAAMSMMTQANAQPQNTLQLLR